MTESVKARLYARSAPNEGRPVSLAWRGNALEIAPADGASWLVAAHHLAFETRGADNSQLAVRWFGDGADRLLMLDASATLAFAENVPGALRERLGRVLGMQTRTERPFGTGLVWVTAFAAMPVLTVALLFSYRDQVADWAVRHAPHSVEQQLGDAALARLRAGGHIVALGPAADALRAIGQRLARPGESLRVVLVDTAEINAYATPGGLVVVTTGLLRVANTPIEVAGVLAHEIAHVELQHGLRQWLRSAGLRTSVGAVFGNWPQSDDIAAHLGELKYSGNAEIAADARGLERLFQARVDPHGLLDLLERLTRTENGTNAPAWLTTHPATRERMQALQTAVIALSAPRLDPIRIDWISVQTSLVH